jgi:hypothetical protein
MYTPAYPVVFIQLQILLFSSTGNTALSLHKQMEGDLATQTERQIERITASQEILVPLAEFEISESARTLRMIQHQGFRSMPKEIAVPVSSQQISNNSDRVPYAALPAASFPDSIFVKGSPRALFCCVRQHPWESALKFISFWHLKKSRGAKYERHN